MLPRSTSAAILTPCAHLCSGGTPACGLSVLYNYILGFSEEGKICGASSDVRHQSQELSINYSEIVKLVTGLRKARLVSFAAGKKGFNHNFRRVSHLFAKFVSNEHSKGLSTERKALIEIRKEISHFTNRSRATIQ